MSKIAVVGDRTSVIGFRGLGFDTYDVDEPAKVRELWPKILTEDYDVIFVTEAVYVAVPDLVFELSEEARPAVTVIPAASGGTGAGSEKIKRIVEKAIGSDVLIREEE